METVVVSLAGDEIFFVRSDGSGSRPRWSTGPTWWQLHLPAMQHLSDTVAVAVAFDADGVSVPAAVALDRETSVSLCFSR
jgi:hypothetical protein